MIALEDRLYTKWQAAKALSVSVKTLEIWIRDGKVKAIKFPSGTIRIHPKQIRKQYERMRI